MKTLKTLISLCFVLLSLTILAQNIEIYVSDAGNWNNSPWQILKFDENGENPEVFIDDDDSILVWPQDIVFLEDQEVVLISNLTTPGYISKHDIATGEFVDYFAENIAGPTRMKIGADNLLYVLQWSNSDNKVLRYQLDGTFVDEFTSNGVPQSIGLDWDVLGNLYVSSYGGKYVQKFGPDGNDMGTFIGSNLAGPTNIWFDENGDLLVVDYNNGSVKRFDQDGAYINKYISGLNYPEGVAFYPDGSMLLGNGGTGAVKLFDDQGTFIEDFVAPGLGDLLTPNAVVIRNVTPVNINKIPSKEKFITPTMGRVFIVNPKLSNSYNTFKIFSMSGVLMAQQEIAENGNFNATLFPRGTYIVLAKGKTGNTISQKIVVK